MRSWVKAYGGLTVAAGIAYFIAIVLSMVNGNLPDGYTLKDVVLTNEFEYVAFIAGTLLALAGVAAVYDGMKTKRGAVTLFGFASIFAGMYISCMHFAALWSNAYAGNEELMLYLTFVFVFFGIATLVKDSLNGFIGGSIVIAILTIAVDLLYVLYSADVNSFYMGLVIGVLIVVSGAIAFPSDKRCRQIVEAKEAEEEAAKKAAEEDAAKKEAEFEKIKAENEAKYKEMQAAKQAAAEEAAKKKAEEEAAKKKAEEEAAKKEAEAKPAEEAKPAAADDAAKKAAEEEAAKKAAAEEAAKKAAAEEAAKKEAEAKPAEEAKPAAAAAAAAAATAAAGAKSESNDALETVCQACYDRDLIFGRDFGAEDIPMAFPTEKLGVYVFEGEPDTTNDAKLESAGWTIIRFDAAEVSDGKKEAEVIIDYLVELAPAESYEEPAEPETVYIEAAPLDFTNEDLGIEPETCETPVRRTAYNMGLRFRRKYGPYKIPVAFVTCKLAVYVFEGEPDTTYDSELEADGWKILRFDGAEVTDGAKEAEVIADYVKQITREQKAAAAKAKRAKARKAAKKSK